MANSTTHHRATEDGGRIIRDTITLHRNHPKSAFAYDPRSGKFVRRLPVADANQGNHRIPAFSIEDAPYRVREWQQKIDFHAGNPKRADDVERWQRQLDIHVIQEQIKVADDADVLVQLYTAWGGLLDEHEAHTKHLQAQAKDAKAARKKSGWASDPAISKRILQGIAKERDYIHIKLSKLKQGNDNMTRKLTDAEMDAVLEARKRSAVNTSAIDADFAYGNAPAPHTPSEQATIDAHVAADKARMDADPYRKRHRDAHSPTPTQRKDD